MKSSKHSSYDKAVKKKTKAGAGNLKSTVNKASKDTPHKKSKKGKM